MLKVESKIGTIQRPDSDIYNFLVDFNNFKSLIPEDKITNWEVKGDTCTFTVEGLGNTGVKIIDKEPYKTIKLTGIESSQYNFFFWVQLKQVDENDTKIRLTIHADINPMIQMMAKQPLKKFLDTMVDQIGKMDFQKGN